METLANQLSAIPEKLGKSFLLAGYLPALLFVLAHQIVFFPRWQNHTAYFFKLNLPEESGGNAWSWIYAIDQTITLLLLPLILGIVLMALNSLIIRFFEGIYPWQQRFLLRYWQRRNEQQHHQIYGNLPVLKQEYTKVLAKLAQLPPETDKKELEQQHSSLALELQAHHDKIPPLHEQLPRRLERVKPTSLGNIFASAEEYPYERYGMDGVLYWPRLRLLVDEEYSTMLVNTKMILDLLLHLSLLALIFGVESSITILYGGNLDRTWLLIALGALCISYLFYRGAVQTAQSLCTIVELCYDFFRDRVLEKFGLSRPDTMDAEQALWLQLGQFLRRGEGFYYPNQHRLQEQK